MEEKELRLRTPVEELDLLMSLATEQSTDQEQQELMSVDLLAPIATGHHGDGQEQSVAAGVTNDLLAPIATSHHGDGQEHEVAMLSSNVDLPLASGQQLDKGEEKSPALSKAGDEGNT